MEILNIKNLNFTYPKCTAPSLRDVSFSIEDGDFTVLCGATGSGKTTLLRLLKHEIAPHGEKNGTILFFGEDISGVACEKVGFVMQNPDMQIVTDKVWHELAFGLENMGVSQNSIAKRVAEMASYFGIEHWYDRDTSTLSGGQKQLLNLAAVMVMDPMLLILDEPTSQLDPIAASYFISTLKKINLDFGITIIIIEHRLEELIPICDRLLVMENGSLLQNGGPKEVLSKMTADSGLIHSIPTAAKLYRMLGGTGDCPLTAREGRRWIKRNYSTECKGLKIPVYKHSDKSALEFKNVYFRYAKHLPDVLKSLDLNIFENEIFCILGGNGSGKTTSLSCAAGILKPYSGQIRIFGTKLQEYKNQSLYRNCISLLPQDITSIFLCHTVFEELAGTDIEMSDFPFDLSYLLDKHPYDLSGGEQQLLALAKVLAAKPKLLLMDEPTKGLDAEKKTEMLRVLHALKKNGITIVIVTHDVEFAAAVADRCALFFRGEVVSVGVPNEFFSENCFYTTTAARMTKGVFHNTVTVEQVASMCLQNGKKERYL